jgi:hypothetical protein
MSKVLSEERLEGIIKHAKGYGSESDFSNPFNVIGYCCEAGGLKSFCVLRDKSTLVSDEVREEEERYLLFLNAVVGRVAELEGETLGLSSVYHSYFNTQDGRNQVDIFLEAIGYRR